MTALDAIDKRTIYFIEGTGQASFVTAWGDGFVTDQGIISQNGLSDPTSFFDRLATMPFLDRVRSPRVHTKLSKPPLVASMSCCALGRPQSCSGGLKVPSRLWGKHSVAWLIERMLIRVIPSGRAIPTHVWQFRDRRFSST